MAPTAEPEVVVIGGGITGLTCTWRLRRAGIDALCLESSNRAGGALSTRHVAGFLVEAGANTVQGSAELDALVRELGLHDELLRVPRDLTRFVYRLGALHPLPSDIRSALGTRLVSARAKWRFAGEFAVRRPSASKRSDESVSTFVRRRFGAEIVDALVAPFVSGTFAGDPAELSARAVLPSLVALEERYGSVLRGVLANAMRAPGRRRAEQFRTLISFRDGLETLPSRLALNLGEATRLGSEALAITRSTLGGRLEVEFREPSGQRRVMTRAVVIACSAWRAAPLLDALAGGASRTLAGIPAASLATVNLAWPHADVSHSLRGLGFLVAAGEGPRTLGCLWNSSIFPGRAPEDQALLAAFLGGARDPQAAALSDGDLVDLSSSELATILGARGRPRVLTVERHTGALPQYSLGHADRMTRVRAAVGAVPGLFIAGNFLSGVSVGECVRQGAAAASDVGVFLRGAVDFSNRSVL
jgi:protoporphyrinogen/coproporphyrinogen III oxidase